MQSTSLHELKSFSHQHIFEEKNNGTLMSDVIHLEAPFGLLGKFVMWLFLKNYFKRLLTERNEVIKAFAETEKWKQVLNEK